MGVGVHFVRDAFCTATASEMGMLEIFLLLSIQSNMHVRWKSGPKFSADSKNPVTPDFLKYPQSVNPVSVGILLEPCTTAIVHTQVNSCPANSPAEARPPQRGS